jgi:putative NADH-flavin reductase
MRVAVFGSSGNLGRALVSQGRSRGWSIGEQVLHSYDPAESLVAALTGSDAVLLIFPASLADPASYPTEVRRVLDATRDAGVHRLIGLVGSAGALTAHGERLVDTDYFGETTRHFYQSVHAAWDVYRTCSDVEWVAFVPAARMQTHLPGRGTYRTRTDERLVTTAEESRRYFDVSQISYADCALAMLDEIAVPAHSREFVTVGW